MKNSRLLLLSGFLLISIAGYSQQITFKVLANKGANEYKSAEGWQPIKTGASLNSDYEIKVSENAYLGLVHVNGKPLELKQAGSYKVADLAAKVQGGTSVLNKYTDFILSSNSAEAKKNRLSATGGITRGGGIHVYLPKAQNASIFGKKMVVEWQKPQTGGPYVVVIRNIFDEELAKFETPETILFVDLSDPKIANESAIMIQVMSKTGGAQPSEATVVKKLSTVEFEKIKKSYSEISADVSTETGFSKFLQAGFYEQNKLIIDALTAYEEAIKLSPDVQDFKIARDEFLDRNNLIKREK